MKKRLARFKVYTERSRWYMVYFQMLLLFALFLSDKGISLIWWQYPLLLVVVACIFIVLGYFEVKLGMMKEEQLKISQENPMLLDILDQLKKLNEKRIEKDLER